VHELAGDGSATERRAGWALAGLAAAFTAAAIARELFLDVPDLNDSAFHLALALRAREASNPADFWLREVGLGFPVFHGYQHLPHLVLVALQKLTGAPMAGLYRVLLGALLAGFPLAVHLALRRFGLAPLVAGLSALAAPLVSTPHLYGIGWESYLWGGSGLFTQAAAQLFAILAVAETFRALRSGRGVALAAVLLGGAFLCHLVYGYIAALSGLAALSHDRGRRAARLLVIWAAAFCAASYFLGPALLDGRFVNHSVWELREKWDSLGAERVLAALFGGRLFDHGRLPSLTVLLGAGLVFGWLRGGAEARALAVLFAAWLVIWFGRATWGALMMALPFSGEIPLHRFVGGVHLFALPLMGCGLFLIWRMARRPLLAAVLVAAVLAPAVVERWRYASLSLLWKREAQAALAADHDVGPLLDELSRLGGRAYVGLPGRGPEHLKVGVIPLTALALVRGIDLLGFLYHSMSFAGDVQVWFDPYDEASARAFGVRFIVLAADRPAPGHARLLRSFGRYRLYQAPSAQLFAAASVPAALPWSKDRAYEVANAWRTSVLPRRDAAPALEVRGPVAGLPSIDLADLPRIDRAPPAVRSLRVDSPWSTSVDLGEPAAVVARIGWHPGLRGTLDGAPAEVLAVAPFFAAVRAPAGRHAVAFGYEPRAKWPWLLLGVLALVAAPSLARKLEPLAERLPPIPRLSVPFWTGPAALALLAGLPLLQGKELAGHDAVQYLTQLSEFDRVLRDGHLPPLWAPDFAAGAGAPFFAFYPPLLLAAAEALHLSGLGLVWSLNLATLGFLVLAAALAALCARELWGPRAGLVAGAAFAFAPYVLLDLYVRHAFLEISALPWMALAAWGAARGSALRVAAGSALLLLAHPALAPFFFPGLLLFAAARRAFKPVLIGCVLGALLAAWSFLPASLERGALKLDDAIRAGYFHYRDHFSYPEQLLWSPWGFGLSVAGRGDGMSFRVGPQLLLLAAVAAWRLRSREAWGLWAMALVAAFLATPLSAPIWDALPLLHAVQFPWRALAVTAFALSLLCGAAFAEGPRGAALEPLWRRPWIGAVALVLLGLPLASPSGFRDGIDERAFAPERIARDALRPGTAGIFEPRGAPAAPWSPQKVRIAEGRASAEVTSFRAHRIEARVVAATAGRLAFTVNDFPGWRASIDGKPAPIEPQGGRISVRFEPGPHSVELRFGASPLRRAAWAVSLATLVGVLAWRFRRRRPAPSR